jgi:hypothetical protein
VSAFKSYVSLEQHLCIVCGKSYDTGTVLLDRRLRESMLKYTVTGSGLCPEHQALHDQGFIALVECDPAKSHLPPSGYRLQPGMAYRTGRIAHLKRDAWSQVFNINIPPDLPLVFVEPGVIDRVT